MKPKPFSKELQLKIDMLKSKRTPVELGQIHFDSPLLLAPMASICNPPLRLLMEDLGAGGTVSELISANGINYENEKTLQMLKIDEREKNVGIQLFGEEGESMAKAAKIARLRNPKFIDINMGCPVRKVVTKGGGSALLKDLEKLAPFLAEIKKALDIPLTIKIRTGWDETDINADKIEKIALNEGIEWVAIHGRTRAQQYAGLANWDYIETLAKESTLPIIGNGDLHQAHQVKERMKKTNCSALMIARGCLRNPFIFLESYNEVSSHESLFHGGDYFEIIDRLYQYTVETFPNERTRLIQMRKLIVWFAAGFPGASKFRNTMFNCKDLDASMKHSEEFFVSLGKRAKQINYDEVFMNSGHG